MWPNMDPRTPYLSQRYLEKTRNIWEPPRTNIKLSYMRIKKCFFESRMHVFLIFLVSHCYQHLWRWGSEIDNNWLNEISKNLRYAFRSYQKNVKWELGKSYKLFCFQVMESPAFFREFGFEKLSHIATTPYSHTAT